MVMLLMIVTTTTVIINIDADGADDNDDGLVSVFFISDEAVPKNDKLHVMRIVSLPFFQVMVR